MALSAGPRVWLGQESAANRPLEAIASEDGMINAIEDASIEDDRFLRLMEQNQQLIQENRNLVEENSKLVEENLFLQEECQRQTLTNAKLMLQLDKLDLQMALTENKVSPRRSTSMSSLHDENGGTPSSSRRSIRLHDDSNVTRRTSVGSEVSPFRATSLDHERGLMGGFGRWSNKDLTAASSSRPRKTPLRGLILRVGHLMHPVPELEAYADFLEKQGFQSRESLVNLTDNLADEFGIPLKLASTLRSEVANKRLKQRYSGPVHPLQDIEERNTLDAPVLQPCETTNYSRHRAASKDPKSTLCREVLRVGHRMHAPWELQKYARILEDNDFSSRESLQALTEEVAGKLRLPLKLAAVLREKALQEFGGVSAAGKKRPSKGSSLHGVQPALQDSHSHSQSSPRASARDASHNHPQQHPPHPAPQRQISGGYPMLIGTQQHTPIVNGPQVFNHNFMPQPLVRQPSVRDHSAPSTPSVPHQMLSRTYSAGTSSTATLAPVPSWSTPRSPRSSAPSQLSYRARA